MKKKGVIIVIVSILAVLLIIGGVFLYKQNKEKKERQEYWDALQTNVEKYDKDFETAEEDEKIEIVKSIQEDLKIISDKTSKNYSEQIEKVYAQSLADKIDYFKNTYNEELEANTLSDLDNISDKEVISGARIKLEELESRISSHKDILLSEEEYEEYNSTITDLQNSYNNRVATIEEEERLAAEEAARKAEEERLAAEEAARKAEEERLAAANNTANNSANNTASNNSGSSNSGSCGPTAPGIPYFATEDEKWLWMESLTFETVPYYDGIRTFYDESGNMVGREKVWGNAHYPEGYSEMYWGGDWEDCLSEKS